MQVHRAPPSDRPVAALGQSKGADMQGCGQGTGLQAGGSSEPEAGPAIPRASAHGRPRARRSYRRPQRRVPRGLVDARCQQLGRLRADGLFGQQVRPPDQHAARRGAVRVPQRPALGDPVVPRPHAGDDPQQRVRGTGRVLARPREEFGRDGPPVGQAARPSSPAWREARAGELAGRTPQVLRDPDRHPRPVVQQGREPVLSQRPRLLRGRLSGGPADPSDRQRLGALRRPVHLEPGGVLRRDGGERKLLARAAGHAQPLPLPPAERVRLPLPEPGVLRGGQSHSALRDGRQRQARARG
mmetsp:Transcript_3067/g.9497  ORF Transcript_3067/g.9497 Transcript_3067/m.9497 type:complete len:299 (+) Transcript_3067:791-1687(+)